MPPTEAEYSVIRWIVEQGFSFSRDPWLIVGAVGNSLFALSILVQWMISERRNESVTPAIFWWLRIWGAVIMVTYFAGKEEPMGIIGYVTGPFFYFRNVVLIHRRKAAGAKK